MEPAKQYQKQIDVLNEYFTGNYNDFGLHHRAALKELRDGLKEKEQKLSGEKILHDAVCSSVALMTMPPSFSVLADGRRVHVILREALINYAKAQL